MEEQGKSAGEPLDLEAGLSIDSDGNWPAMDMGLGGEDAPSKPPKTSMLVIRGLSHRQYKGEEADLKFWCRVYGLDFLDAHGSGYLAILLQVFHEHEVFISEVASDPLKD